MQSASEAVQALGPGLATLGFIVGAAFSTLMAIRPTFERRGIGDGFPPWSLLVPAAIIGWVATVVGIVITNGVGDGVLLIAGMTWLVGLILTLSGLVMIPVGSIMTHTRVGPLPPRLACLAIGAGASLLITGTLALQL